VAGSGKTTVALHRLSYLMYNFKKSIRPEEFLIISPNDIFLSYISNTLVDLDADKSNSFSFSKLIKDIIGGDYEVLGKSVQYNKLTKNKIDVSYLKYKNSLEFARCLESFLEDYVKTELSKPLKVQGVEILGKDIISKYLTINDYQPLTTTLQH
jgi:DNA helicase-2/ATP-dependent DNA helicase PcrA